VLGLWLEQAEGAKFWLRVMNELRDRGVADILIAVVDGLKGFPEAISAVFPKTQVQARIVHTIRTQSVGGRDRTIAARLRRAQGNNMADLQAAVADDDALNHQLQDPLLLVECRLIEAGADAGAERRQARPDRLGLGALPA
jgi:hypothetical protein